MVGHIDRIGLNDEPPAKSWNTSHPSRGPEGGCSQNDLRSTGGNGFFYCFATNWRHPPEKVNNDGDEADHSPPSRRPRHVAPVTSTASRRQRHASGDIRGNKSPSVAAPSTVT